MHFIKSLFKFFFGVSRVECIEKKIKAYCLGCGGFTDSREISRKRMKNGAFHLRGICSICGRKVNTFSLGKGGKRVSQRGGLFLPDRRLLMRVLGVGRLSL